MTSRTWVVLRDLTFLPSPWPSPQTTEGWARLWLSISVSEERFGYLCSTIVLVSEIWGLFCGEQRISGEHPESRKRPRNLGLSDDQYSSTARIQLD